MTVDEEAMLPVARDRPRTSIWLGIAWLLVAACLGLMSWTLLQLDSADIYILLAPDINTITVGTLLSLLAMVPAITGIYLLTRYAVASTRSRWVARLVKASGWVAGICVGLVSAYSALAMFLLTPVTAYTLQSPNDGRSVLIVNRTVLLAGGFTVYEPRNWPTYVEVGSLTTNNAHDPFGDGAYRAVWTDEGLELEFVSDYMKPDRYEHKFIEFRL
ncbi:hypothetical protein ACIQF8_09125 [Pseudarthrobacter sp. NPDC092184]|uniref:hypothetical protein n=1 Tax=unclassified Pseudarthrobacter TaxID=2647000 RepID=UPI0032EF87DD